MARAGHRGDRLVAVIGVFKLFKAALLVSIGVGALSGAAAEATQVHLVRWSGALPGHQMIRGAIERLAELDRGSLRELAIVALCYAAVFVVEGVGLIAQKRWAEWMTVAVTASFVPFECYELARHPGAGKVAALVINVAIVAFLAWRRMQSRAARVSSQLGAL
jgi:uncharacterized membrane protein (DUF2068 family)